MLIDNDTLLLNSYQRGYTLPILQISFIENCIFERSTIFQGNGGIIFVSSSHYLFLTIFMTSFFNCTCYNYNQPGSGIYINSINENF